MDNSKRPKKTIGKRPSSADAAVSHPRYHALLDSIVDTVSGRLDSNAAGYARATRTEAAQVEEAVRVLHGGAPEQGSSAVSAPGLFVACGRCSPLDAPIDGCPDCRFVIGHDLAKLDWPVVVVDHKMRVCWVNNQASQLLHEAQPKGKLLRTVAAWSRTLGIEHTPIVLQVETVKPYSGNLETFRREKSRLPESVGLRAVVVTLPNGSRASNLFHRAK